MDNTKRFAEKIAGLNLTRVGQAIALLWFYRQTQTFDERSAQELADDLHDVGLGKPNITELKKALTKSPITVKGKRAGTFQINIKYLDQLNSSYATLINWKEVNVSASILSNELAKNTRLYIERMIYQINGAYDYGFYDACAVMLRRLMESLLIEIFITKNLASEIKINNVFVGLDDLIKKISNHKTIHLGRSTPDTMAHIKQIGDTAAHDRTYITKKIDIDDYKLDIRKTLEELLNLAEIIK